MAEYAVPVDSIDNRYYRRAAVTAVFYAVIDLLILVFGGLFVPFRLVGVIAAYFVIRDMMVLREAGVEWGWTRYVVLVFVAIGGFLGFIIYAWRRYSHLEAIGGEGDGDEAGETETEVDSAEDTGVEDVQEPDHPETEEELSGSDDMERD